MRISILFAGFPALGYSQSTVQNQAPSISRSSTCLNVYQITLSECDSVGMGLNDSGTGTYLCGFSGSLWDVLLPFMIELKDMDPSTQEWSRICTILEPIAKAGHELSTQGMGPEFEARTRDDLNNARWRIASMHNLLQFSF